MIMTLSSQLSLGTSNSKETPSYQINKPGETQAPRDIPAPASPATRSRRELMAVPDHACLRAAPRLLEPRHFKCCFIASETDACEFLRCQCLQRNHFYIYVCTPKFLAREIIAQGMCLYHSTKICRSPLTSETRGA